MNRQGGIIGFNDGVWHFRGRNNAKRVHNTVRVFLTDLWNQESPFLSPYHLQESVWAEILANNHSFPLLFEQRQVQNLRARRLRCNGLSPSYCQHRFVLHCKNKTTKKRKQQAISSGFATPVTGFLSLRKGSHEKQFSDQIYFLSPLLHVSLWSSCKTGRLNDTGTLLGFFYMSISFFANYVKYLRF